MNDAIGQQIAAALANILNELKQINQTLAALAKQQSHGPGR
ncbi:MAG TPA: hypothetical protein VH744_03580 [Terriglobales bacterium]|jgi:hypothetical protein